MQNVYLIFIIVLGLFLSVYLVSANKEIIKTFLSGILIAFLGLSLEVMFGTPLSNVLLLQDMGSFGGAWIAGCMIVFGAIIAWLIKWLNSVFDK